MRLADRPEDSRSRGTETASSRNVQRDRFTRILLLDRSEVSSHRRSRVGRRRPRRETSNAIVLAVDRRVIDSMRIRGYGAPADRGLQSRVGLRQACRETSNEIAASIVLAVEMHNVRPRPTEVSRQSRAGLPRRETSNAIATCSRIESAKTAIPLSQTMIDSVRIRGHCARRSHPSSVPRGIESASSTNSQGVPVVADLTPSSVCQRNVHSPGKPAISSRPKWFCLW
jgi:hypothetical protein